MFDHVTVLLKEAVEGLNIKADGIYVDCTLGGAGHSCAILKQLTTGHLYCFDQDQTAIEAARLRLDAVGNNYTIIYSNFVNIKEKLNELLHFLSAKKYSEMPDKQNRVLDYGALKINAEYRSVESNGELVQLTNYEFEILYLLAKNPGRIFSKEQIYTQVWKEPYYGAEDNVMGIIRRIRKKIEPDSAKPRYILNVWGMGYKFNGELMK